MQRQNVTVLIKDRQVETWGSLKKACRAHGWKYSTMGQRALPTTFEGWSIFRSKFNELAEEVEETEEVDSGLLFLPALTVGPEEVDLVLEEVENLCIFCRTEISEDLYYCSKECADAHDND